LHGFRDIKITLYLPLGGLRTLHWSIEVYEYVRSFAGYRFTCVIHKGFGFIVYLCRAATSEMNEQMYGWMD